MLGLGLGRWLRHHLVALVVTLIDYAVMVACVERLGLGPVSGAAVGALFGAICSFGRGRWFTYQTIGAAVGAQASRFVLVAGASLGWNAAGEYLFASMLGLQYVVARIITSVIVSNGWNYPMQKLFVFSIKESSVGSSSHA
jgi:putative flippase GtrA